jgi:predicted dehydrogenase
VIRIGLVGAGSMGRRHAAFVDENLDCRLAAVADPHSRAVAEAAGVPWFPSHRELLAAGDVDAVIIANPNADHVASAIDALEVGVAVLLEKPVATSHPEGVALVEAVDRTAGRLLVGHHRRHHPTVIAAREALAAGQLGKLVAVSGIWAARKHDDYFDDEWHRDSGAGVMLINLIHDVDLLRHLVGEPTLVQAVTSNQARGLAVEDTVALTLTFDDGVIGSFLATDAGASPWGWDQATTDSEELPYVPNGSAYFLTGTRGALAMPTLIWYSYPADSEAEWRTPMIRQFLPRRSGNSYSHQLRHFVEVVRGTTPPLVSAEDAVRSLAVVEAARASAERNAAVDVQEFIAGLGVRG